MYVTDIIESMNTNTITLSNTCGVKASRQLANDCTGLVPADRSLRPDRVDIDLQIGSES